MNIQLEIKTIQQELEEMHDEGLIKAIKSVLAFARKTRYESSLKPMSLKTYTSRANASEKDIKAGRTIDLDSLKEESEGW